MVAPFNACKVDVAMPGNHDFDFGAVQMRKVIANMTTNEFRPEGIRDEEKLELRKRMSIDKRVDTGLKKVNSSIGKKYQEKQPAVHDETAPIVGVDIDPHPTRWILSNIMCEDE